MGLRADIQRDIAAAFDTDLSDAVRKVTFVNLASSGYDPATGDVTTVEERYPSRAAIEPYTAKQIGESGGSITNKDLQVILLTNEVDTLLKTGMRMEIEGVEETYSLEVVIADPAGASYTIQARS